MTISTIIQSLEEQRDRIDEAISALGGSTGTRGGRGRRSGWRLSAAARRKISLAQKKRWAERKKKGA
ncbi:MAG TPA: hypothetical protein VJ723_02145 [Candidatus Angelobacter sp.]|nr:hypothetical protein [Candidatus Angelobacter sp.]